MNTVLLVAIVIAQLLVSALATRAALQDEFSTPSQKILQIGISWILPIVGALLVLAVHRQPEKPSHRFRESPDAGDDHGASGTYIRRITETLDGD